ncbi:MAG: hypothetical protein HKM05_02690 [Spirochaetales bacterium]|nr:hypothetical protein [Spirochaetales bacterium]
MPGYSFAGLRIYAEGELPLPPGAEPWDLFIKHREFSHDANDLVQDAVVLSWVVVKDHYALRAGGIDFVLREQLLEVNRPLESAADMIVRAALGFVAVTRGLCSFHGSAAARTGSAVLIVGNKGAGKSTTVTGLLRRGWGLLCDDLVSVNEGIVSPTVLNTRLLPDVWPLLGGDSQALPGADGKFALSFPAATSTRLKATIVLRVGDALAQEEVTGHRKLQMLLPHLNNLPGVGDPAARLAAAAQTVAPLRVVMLTRPVQRLALDEVLDAIEAIVSDVSEKEK